MMIVAALAAFALGQTPTEPVSATQLVSNMLAYYSAAKTLTGTIDYTASDGAGQAGVRTTIQFEKPSKLYIRQDKVGGQTPGSWLVTSDGQHFSYDPPQHLIETRNPRLVESVKTLTGQVLDIQGIYAVVAFGSLGDRSIPLDIAISRREDLAHDVLQWATVVDNGKRTLGDVETRSIIGVWKPFGDAPAEGNFELNITADGQLKRYAQQHSFRLPSGSVVNLTEVWNVNLKVDGKPDPTLFKLVK